jgi:hypothetical protein
LAVQKDQGDEDIMVVGALRKWHFDLADDAGKVLWGELSAIRVAGISWGMAEAHFLTADGRIISDRQVGRHPFVRPSGWPRFRDHQLGRLDGRLHAAMDLPALRFDLLYHPTAPGWLPAGRGLHWESPDIRARVEGTVDSGSGAAKVSGTGYVDVMSGAMWLPGRPAAGFLRGRAHFPSETVVFGQFPAGDGGLLQGILIRRDQAHDAETSTQAAGNCRQRLRRIEDVQFFARAAAADGELTIVHPLFSLTLRDGRILDGSPQGRPGPGLRDPLARFLRRLSGAESREKVAASARLEIAGCTAFGTALYERDQWTSGSA